MIEKYKEAFDAMEKMANKAIVGPNGPVTFTLEREHGETYGNPNAWALYAHDEYERGSVLEGQPRRTFVDEIGTEADADAFLSGVVVVDSPSGGGGFCLSKIEGTTHIPVDQAVAHLSDEPDHWHEC